MHKKLLYLNINKIHDPVFKMGQVLEWSFLQRLWTSDKQAHEKMLNVISNQGNASQNHHKILHFTSMAIIKKKKRKKKETQKISIGKDVEKADPCTLLVGM